MSFRALRPQVKGWKKLGTSQGASFLHMLTLDYPLSLALFLLELTESTKH